MAASKFRPTAKCFPVENKRLACGTYDGIARIDQGAEVENKRLAHAHEAARLLQAKRDDRRACDAPSRTHRGEQVQARKALEGLKKQRALDIADMNEAILEVSAKALREQWAAAPPQRRNPNGSKQIIRSKRDICS